MPRLILFLLPILLFSSCRNVLQTHQQDDRGEPYIRVCLADGVKDAELVLEPGAVLQTVGRTFSLEGHSTLTCSIGEGGDMEVLVDGRPAREFSGVFRCYSTRRDGRFGFGGRLYSDTLLFASDGRSLYLVNILPVEDYLRGVLPEVIGRNRKQEEFAAVCAQAILARTYARAKIDLPLRRLFDVHADHRDQPFGGLMAHDGLTDRAVEDTRGEVLLFGEAYAETFYHAACGGNTEAVSLVLERQQSRPYLTGVSDRSRQGDWCRVSPSYRWTEEYSRGDIERMLRRTLPDHDDGGTAGDIPDDGWHLLDMKILRRMPSGRVEEMLLVVGSPSHQRALHLHGSEIRTVLEREEGKPLRSAMIDIFLERDENRWIRNVRISGGGRGHGIGFCQWGAIGRARAGYSAEAILEAYFPGTDVAYEY